MMEDAQKLRRSLRSLGLSDPAITAAWPAWWSDDAENSSSAQAELRFSLSRKLGLDPRSLMRDDAPRFVWRENAKFKGGTADSDNERAALSSFGTAIAKALLGATPTKSSIVGIGVQKIRSAILSSQRFVRLVDLLGLCWSVGIPVIHLRVFPLSAKRMCAMAVKVDDRYVIMIGKDARYPAPTAFHLAHEIGHVVLEHLKNSSAIIDMSDTLEDSEGDEEEIAADQFALELLLGDPELQFASTAQNFTARQLAESALQTSEELRVEPGTLALCLGHNTGDWQKAYAAMNLIYTERHPVWSEINDIAISQLDWSRVTNDMAPFIHSLLERQ